MSIKSTTFLFGYSRTTRLCSICTSPVLRSERSFRIPFRIAIYFYDIYLSSLLNFQFAKFSIGSVIIKNIGNNERCFIKIIFVMEISRRNLSVFFSILYSILYSVIKYSFAFGRNSFKLLIQTYVVIT